MLYALQPYKPLIAGSETLKEDYGRQPEHLSV